jgi:aminoglycoside phosphotransferase (APT) family kinase protein
MTQAWSAECVVSADLARELIAAQFPHLAPVRVELLGAGWDNTAFRVNGGFVFRFPRRQIAVPLLESEARLLPAIAARLPLPVPVPDLVGRPTDSYPWPFAGYALIPGRTACAAALDEGQRSACAGPLGRFLAALHAVSAEEAVRRGAGPDPLGRFSLARRVPWARTALEQLARSEVLADIRPLTDLLDAAPASYDPRADTLVHGDLYVRHLLVDTDNRLAGVIDWGDIHLGDRASDLMIVHSFLPPSAHSAFREAYGAVEEITWRMARLRALWHTAAVLIYGHETGDADLVREGRLAMRYLALG